MQAGKNITSLHGIEFPEGLTHLSLVLHALLLGAARYTIHTSQSGRQPNHQYRRNPVSQ
jgi:hypothetical protein